jgi:hypothetical protein
MPMSDISPRRTPPRPLRSARPPGLAGWRRRGPGDQAAGVHGVQVMRQRGLARSYRLGEFPLLDGLADVQVEQEQPDRQGAAASQEPRRTRALRRGPSGSSGARSEETALARQPAYYQASTSNRLTSNPSISNVVVTVATGPAAAAKQEGTCVMSKPAVEAHGLREAFSQVQALDGLSLAVPTAVGAAVGLSGDLRLRAGHRHTRLAACVRHPSAGRRPGQHRTGADPLRPAAHDILISLAWSGGSLIVFALLAACTYARMRR